MLQCIMLYASPTCVCEQWTSYDGNGAYHRLRSICQSAVLTSHDAGRRPFPVPSWPVATGALSPLGPEAHTQSHCTPAGNIAYIACCCSLQLLHT